MRTVFPVAAPLLALLALASCTMTEAAPVADRASAPIAAADTATDGAAPAVTDWSVYELASTWRDARGDTVRLADLGGRVQLVAMVYTSCRATCPLILADLRRIDAALPADRRDRVGFVLVSLDPARDTPGVLAAWGAASRLDERWTLLNGDDAAVRELAATLGVRYEAQRDGEVAHTNGVTVLDPTGAIAHVQTRLGDGADVTAAVVARLLR